jgi:hypothetical protein
MAYRPQAVRPLTGSLLRPQPERGYWRGHQFHPTYICTRCGVERATRHGRTNPEFCRDCIPYASDYRRPA